MALNATGGFHLVGEAARSGRSVAAFYLHPGWWAHAMAMVLRLSRRACPRPIFSSCACRAPLLVAKAAAAEHSIGRRSCARQGLGALRSLGLQGNSSSLDQRSYRLDFIPSS